MEYLESTMETIIFDNVVLLEMTWHQPQTSLVTLMQLWHVVLWTKNVIWMSEIKDIQ